MYISFFLPDFKISTVKGENQKHSKWIVYIAFTLLSLFTLCSIHVLHLLIVQRVLCVRSPFFAWARVSSLFKWERRMFRELYNVSTWWGSKFVQSVTPGVRAGSQLGSGQGHNRCKVLHSLRNGFQEKLIGGTELDFVTNISQIKIMRGFCHLYYC